MKHFRKILTVFFVLACANAAYAAPLIEIFKGEYSGGCTLSRRGMRDMDFLDVHFSITKKGILRGSAERKNYNVPAESSDFNTFKLLRGKITNVRKTRLGLIIGDLKMDDGDGSVFKGQIKYNDVLGRLFNISGKNGVLMGGCFFREI